MRKKRPDSALHASQFPQLLLLSLFFFCGICLGQVLSARMPDETGQELTAYLRQYVTLETGLTPQAILSALVLYLRYPLLALLLGYLAIGAVLLPCMTVVFGFSLSFSVCCMTAAFGKNGILLALAVFGVRCAVTLPCYLLIAVPAWERSISLALLSLGRGRRSAPVGHERTFWLLAVACSLLLLAGMCVDLLCSSRLLRMALEHILS